eukprot:SAG11_NODE_176_length_13359_cov_10.862142_3_plen_81_part_00
MLGIQASQRTDADDVPLTQVTDPKRGKGFDHTQRLRLDQLQTHFLHNGLIYRTHRGQELLCVPDLPTLSDRTYEIEMEGI